MVAPSSSNVLAREFFAHALSLLYSNCLEGALDKLAEIHGAALVSILST